MGHVQDHLMIAVENGEHLGVVITVCLKGYQV
jgi:hypothetical protein